MTTFGPFRLDPANQCLWRAAGDGEGERVLLTPIEYGVLAHLVARAGRLVTHRELLDAVWPRTAIEPQAVKSNIFRLRRVLEDDPKNPRYIETLPRRGYRFVAGIEADATVPVHTDAPGTPLVGREAATAELRECLRNASAGLLQIVFVTGEPGIGKTALVEAFARDAAAASPVRIARGQCVEGFGSKEAFYPVLDAVGALCHGPDGPLVVEVLASRAPTWLVQLPAMLTREHRETLQQEILGSTRERMLREICEALAVIGAQVPLLVVLEDLHWADPSTLDLLSALARRRTSSRLMVLGTYRPADVASSVRPLHALKRDLVARHLSREIALQPLTEGEIARFLAAGHPTVDVPADLAALLHRHTEGNPLFVIAVLDHLVRRDLVETVEGAWRLRRSAAEISLEVPESLRDMIAAQIEGLPEGDQRALEVAAVAGMSFAPAISAPSADLDTAAFDACCDALARRGLILRLAGTMSPPGTGVVQRYAFVHALYRETLYERLAPARRALLHRRRAERLQEAYAGALDMITPELAHHFELGQDWTRAVGYLRRAADLAVSRHALEDAKSSLRRALALADRLPAAERGSAEVAILTSLVDVHIGTFDPAAIDPLTLLRERAARQGLLEVEVKTLIDLAYPLAWSSSERSLEVVEQALQLSHALPDPLARARVHARCMMRRIWAGGWSAEDAAACARALDQIRRGGSERDVAWHVIDCTLVDFFASKYRGARLDAIASLATLEQAPEEGRAMVYAQSVRALTGPWCLIMLGEWGAALREIDAGLAATEKNGDPYGGQTFLLSRCWALLFAMDFEGARAAAGELLPDVQQSERAPWRRLAGVIMGAAAAGLGRLDDALARLTAVQDDMAAQPALGDWYWRLWLEWGLTNVWLARGDLPRARAAADRFTLLADATAERTWQGLAWESSARAALASGDGSRAEVLVERALATIDGAEVPVAEWQVHATAADAARLSGDSAAAARHRDLASATILRLAASFGPEYEGARHAFLAAPAVARVLDATTLAAPA